MRRGSIIQLVATGVVAAGIATAVALLVPWLPPAYGKEAQRIHFVFWFATVIAIAVFAVVAAVLSYAIIRFRVRPDDDSDGPPTHGHTTLEIVWTAIPAVLVTAISIVSAVVLAQNSHAGTDPLLVNVRAQQFAWSFTYPNGKTYGYLTLPENRSTKLRITSNDVIHSFWVPVLSQKQDAVPGQFNTIVVTPIHTGTFPVICTELCGLGHALMRSHVVIMKENDFNTWYRKGGRAAAGPPGLAVFQSNGCGSCHTFKPAGATGNIGPDLDKLVQYAKQANRGSLTQFIHESIVNPGAYIQPGYQNLMPSTFGQSIPPANLDQLVQYLAQGAKS
ncbi:MAG TPA: cytochrome c oxidase subunit II [Gaiellaceae bacterium]|nr:cytochrome c oxidase subunit II [Gaiellaceae bacterium]